MANNHVHPPHLITYITYIDDALGDIPGFSFDEKLLDKILEWHRWALMKMGSTV